MIKWCFMALFRSCLTRHSVTRCDWEQEALTYLVGQYSGQWIKSKPTLC